MAEGTVGRVSSGAKSADSSEPLDVTRGLRADHELILRALTALERCAGRINAPGGGAASEGGHLETLVEFFQQFVDRWHHGKEEEALLPSLLYAGIPADSGPLPEVLAEHARAKELLARLSSGDRVMALATIPEYSEFLRQHFLLEERGLFPLADRSLDPLAKQKVLDDFGRFDAHIGTPADRARFEAQIAHLLVPLSELDPKPKHPW